MREIKGKAYAKINLTLDVLCRREDGYHELSMLMQSVGLSDEIELCIGTGRPDSACTNLSYLPGDEKNIALLAAKRFFSAADIDAGGISVRIHKSIPV